MSILSRVTSALFGAEITAQVNKRVNLAVAARDDSRDRLWSSSGASERDRYSYKRADILRDALEAWRENPLARRIVELTSQYVVGGGLGISSEDVPTNDFLQEMWRDDLNRFQTRAYEWCDELTRSGELYIVLSTDAGGMSYVRAIPACEIDAIEHAPNDVEQETVILQKPYEVSGDPVRWQVYDKRTDSIGEDGLYPSVMLHFAINRPVGAQFGESDLAPILKWLVRYGAWLEDRARLNRFRNLFVFWVKKAFQNEAERLARQSELNLNPPNPGTVLVTNDDEEWSVIAPKLESHEAGEDGLALKKVIAAGAGVPLHFLAEPESSTRTTAEQAGGPTFRHYEQRQIFFLWMVETIFRAAIRRAAGMGRNVNPKATIKAKGTDIFARDNAGLAVAARSIIGGFVYLRARGLIDDSELLRLAYRFAGEVVDVAEVLKNGAKAEKWEDLFPAVTKPTASSDTNVSIQG